MSYLFLKIQHANNEMSVFSPNLDTIELDSIDQSIDRIPMK